MKNIKIVGKTNSQYINLIKIQEKGEKEVSPFLVDEFFVIEDALNGNPICRIIETIQIPLINCDFKNEISEFGIKDTEIESIFLAKAQIEREIYYPVKINSIIREPEFKEIKELLYTCDIKSGISVGEIRGTEKLFSTIPSGWNDSVCMMKNSLITKQTRAPFVFDYRKMEQFPHIGLFGGSGSGKTFALKAIIEELIKKHIPMIVLDPHYEMSFDKNIEDVPEHLKYNFSPYVKTFSIGENVGIDFTTMTSNSLIDILRFSGEMSQPMEAAIHTLHIPKETFISFRDRLDEIIEAFQEGEANKLGKKPNPPLYEKYSKRISGLSTLIAISWRINDLERQGVFESNTLELEKALMAQKTCVIRGPIQLLNVVGSYVANVAYEKRRKYVDGLTMHADQPQFVPFIIIMDEAHSFAPSSSATKSPMNSILETISKEGRKYGIFEILATQRPKLLNPTISAQLSTKYVFRTVDKSDIEAIKRETDLDENSLSRLPFMEAGACFVSSAINGKCMSIKIKANTSIAKITTSPFDELGEVDDVDCIFEENIIKLLPINGKNMESAQTSIEKILGEKFTLTDFKKRLDELVKNERISYKSGMAFEYYKI